jgi:antitoxin (DNA-binding transcriptional repressor) of toxin-antitoxin stability system
MTNIINISDFRNNISDYINRVIYNKEYFLLKRGKKIVTKVVNYQKSKESKKEKKSLDLLIFGIIRRGK